MSNEPMRQGHSQTCRRSRKSGRRSTTAPSRTGAPRLRTQFRRRPSIEVVEPPAGRNTARAGHRRRSCTASVPTDLAWGWLAALLRLGHFGEAAENARQAPARANDSVPLWSRAVAGDFDVLLSAGLVRFTETRAARQAPTLTRSLTENGAAVVRQVIAGLESLVQEGGPADAPQPCWNRLRHELRLEDLVVKRFRRPATNQELILDAFQEQGWPERIDDPLPQSPSVDPRQRLHETIKSLNQCTESSAIRFGGDGTGLGVRWSLRAAGLRGGHGVRRPTRPR